MKIYNFWLLIISISILTAAGCSQRADIENKEESVFTDLRLRQIYDAANQHDLKTLELFAHHETAAYRMAYAKCMASVLDTNARENLYALLNDPIPYVRLYASFAVGQYRDTASLPALEKALKKATIPEIKAEVLEAIGKSADANALEYLIFHEPSNAVEETGKMWGIYNAALRGLLKEEHLRIVVAHLASREPETREAAIHTLHRQRSYDLTPYREKIENTALTDKNSGLRATAVMAMRHIKDCDDILIKIASHDPDPKVRAAAILSISDSNTIQFQDLISKSLEDGSVWVAMNAANRLSGQWPVSYLKNLEHLALTSSIPEVKSAIVTAYLSNDSLRMEGENLWKRLHFKNDVEKSTLLKSIGYLSHMTDTLLKYSLEDSPLGTAATEGIVIAARKFPDQKDLFYKQAKKAFELKLPAQSYLYANAALEPVFFDEKKLPLQEMERAVESFDKAATIETFNEVQKAIAVIKGLAYKPQTRTDTRKIDWDLVEKIPVNATARIYLGKKRITLSLLVEDAPATVSNFVALANAKFYDHTYFHRVVPVFVSQGGGPRGDGFGSADYTIRSEFSPLKFGAGVAGMASAGKDTESCQFFFTQIATPHLNGRYTIFGAITENLLYLSEITTGTKIDSVRIDIDTTPVF